MKSKKLPPIHPGEILKEEILAPRKISQVKLAQEINVSPKLVSEICQKKRNLELVLNFEWICNNTMI